MRYSLGESSKTFGKFISKRINNLPVPASCHIFDFQRQAPPISPEGRLKSNTTLNPEL
jgi:hypothetical protein